MERFLNILYPKTLVCAVCGRETIVSDRMLCADCEAKLITEPTIDCPEMLDGICAGLTYTEALHAPVAAFKYRRSTWLAPFLAQFMLIPDTWQIDCIVPVPLHPLRQLWRTFNQSELLARHVGRRYHIPVSTKLLFRTRFTKPQARLSAAERRTNLNGVFRASRAVFGRSILLIDDVTTTHTTLTACAEALRRQGAAHVYALTACCAPAPHKSTEAGE